MSKVHPENTEDPTPSGDEDLATVALRAAHKLNNIVTVILASSDAVLASHPDDVELVENATDIKEAATRIAELTEAIFTASRRRPP